MFKGWSKHARAILPVFLVLHSVGQGQDTDPSVEVIQAKRLLVADLNFSIRTPGKDWNWHRKELGEVEGKKATIFTVADPLETTQFIVLVWERETRRTGPIKDIDWLTKAFQQGLPAGWTPSNPQVSDSDLPLAGSMKFSSTVIAPDGAKHYLFGYATQGKRLSQFIAYNFKPTEPPFFSEMVRSFRVLNPNENVAEPFVFANVVLWYFVLLGFTALATMVIDVGFMLRSRKRYQPIVVQGEHVSTESSANAQPSTQTGLQEREGLTILVQILVGSRSVDLYLTWMVPGRSFT